MENQIPKEKIDSFDFVVRRLNTAIKNSALYLPSHPVFDSAVKNLRDSLDTWFQTEDKLDLGVTENNLLLDGQLVKESSDIYAEVAQYLHRRGVMALRVERGVEAEELLDLMMVLKLDDKEVRLKGGLLSVLKPAPHVKVKAVDYSNMLSSALVEVTGEEQNMWQSLCSISNEAKEGQLPGSKTEFLNDFLKDPKRSAGVLNKLYKQASIKFEDGSAIDEIRSTMTKITKYFEKYSGGDPKADKKKIADIIAKLDPTLVLKVFEDSEVDGEKVDLAGEITKDFSDDMISDFLSSVIGTDGGVNENLLKLFDKMVKDKSKTENVASMVTDNLLQKMVDKNSLKQLGTSIKELLKMHPENDFMSQMYKLTLDTFVSESMPGEEDNKNKLTMLVQEFKIRLKEENIRKERIRLLMNIMWLEKEPSEFKKFSEKVVSYFSQLIEAGDVECIRDVFEFFANRVGGHKIFHDVKNTVDGVLREISSAKTADKLVAMVPEADDSSLDNIASIFSFFGQELKMKIVDAFVLEADPFNKDKYVYVFMGMGKNISGEMGEKVYGEDPESVRGILKILKLIDPDCCKMLVKNLLDDKNPRIRCEALRSYVPLTNEEIEKLFVKFNSEKEEQVRDMILESLLGTRYWEVIDRLFKEAEKNPKMNKYFIKLVKVCGDSKIVGAIPYLEKVMFKREFFGSAKSDELKVAAVVSLGQIHAPEAIAIVKKGLSIKNEAVKRMCEIVLSLGDNGKKSD